MVCVFGDCILTSILLDDMCRAMSVQQSAKHGRGGGEYEHYEQLNEL
jgi:hypothetical protein